MYYPQNSTPSRREPAVTTHNIQKILDDNVDLIHRIINHQKTGNNNHEAQELQHLHKNLIFLATIADQATNSGAAAQRPPPTPAPPPSGFMSGPVGPPEHLMGSQAPPPPNASYPPGPPQQRGQPPMPGSYNLPPVVGRSLSSLTGPLNLGAPMMSQHPNPMSQPQPQHQQVDDRIYMQQRGGAIPPPYGYPPGVPHPPPQQSFSMSPGSGFGPPRYDSTNQQPLGTMPSEANGMPTESAPPVSGSINAPSSQSVPPPSTSAPGGGSVGTPPPKGAATSPNMSDQQQIVVDQMPSQQQPLRTQSPATSVG